jgi:Ferritin-like domain
MQIKPDRSKPFPRAITILRLFAKPRAIPMTYVTRLDLADRVRKGAGALLQARLSDALDLETQTKQAHWNVPGPTFFQLHLLFDKLHDECEEIVDVVAERKSFQSQLV